MLATTSRQANNTTKRKGVGRITPCCHQYFFSFLSCKEKKMKNKVH